MHKRRTAGTLRVSKDDLVVDARAEFRGRLEIPWDSIRKAVVDDGGRWGYVSEVCRFPVYADRPDGPGHGTLIGPLWSQASSLMPPRCPVPALDPVPARAPNVALIFDPGVAAPTQREQSGHGSTGVEPIVGLLLRVDDPDAAREALGSKLTIGDLDQGDLDYLIRIARGGSGNGQAGNGASRSASLHDVASVNRASA